MEAACASLDTYISARTFFVGYAVTAADYAVYSALVSSAMWLKLKRSCPALNRWFEYMSALPIIVETSAQFVTKRGGAGAGAGTKGGKGGKGGKGAASGAGGAPNGKGNVEGGGENGGSFDIDLLKDVEMGTVVTRFPPEPSGYLHIGHAKAALINQEIANRYQGKLLVRFDDTNPSKEKDEYVENIIADIARLGLVFEKITYTSDYFPELVDCAERMIGEGMVYADDTPVEKMRDERMHGVESERRGISAEETLAIFRDQMMLGTDEGKRWCLRVKMDMTAANKALRDPVFFRCNPTHHWRTGDKYKCYPTYDFACPFVDAYEGVTHALRTSEYKDREAQFYWMLKLQQQVWPSLPHVHIWDYSRLSFIYTVLSKRKLTWFVTNGLVDGWADPRMPTVQGMLRRGLQLPALREFIIFQGASKSVTYQEWDKIWAINKKIIDPVCPRHTAIATHLRVPVTLRGGADPAELIEVPKHLKYPPAGMKKQLRSSQLWLDQSDAVQLVEGEEVTLMAWGNAIINTVHRDPQQPEVVTGVDATLHLEGDYKKTKLKLTWLGQSTECPVMELRHFGYLVTKRKLEEGDAFEEFVNRNSVESTRVVGDGNLREGGKGDVIQLERRGYYIIDEPFDAQNPEKPIVLFDIPDGKAKPVPGISDFP